jgi:hypothetical protein
MQREKVVDGEVDYGLAVGALAMPRRTP